MIPTEDQAKVLWNTYGLPEKKRLHVTLVTRVALFFARKSQEVGFVADINIPLLRAGGLLNDIDKAVPRLPGEQHPDTAVRVLHEEGMDEVAEVVRRHPLHAIIDPALVPKTSEEKFLYLADKMVKFEILTVDQRFQLWRDEHLPPEAVKMLDACYPKVKELERQILSSIGVLPQEVASLA